MSDGHPTLTALEDAIRANPDDVGAHGAYADALMEQGDPRGEFMAVQIALEDEKLPGPERKKLQQREAELLETHEKEWVGDWVDLFPPWGATNRDGISFDRPTWRFVRGILAEATIEEINVACARAFIRSPQLRMIRRLTLGGYAFEEGRFERHDDLPDDELARYYPGLFVFERWPHFGNLRFFQVGWTTDENYDQPYESLSCHFDGERVHEWVMQMPQIEELYLFAHRVNGKELFALPMPRMRVLQVYHSSDYALGKLANNASLGNLTSLLCHPHALEVGDEAAYIRLDGLRAITRSRHLGRLKHLRLRLADFGDDGCREIVESGILQRLETLDLRHGRVTDAGARMLADCPDLKRLKNLDLSWNALTPAGIQALDRVGIFVNTGHAYDPADESWPDEYLGAGDIE